MATAIAQVKDSQKRDEVRVWFMDEHRIGLKPITRKQWARRGQRPVGVVNHRFEWCYLYGFVEPKTGKCQLPLYDKVNHEQFSLALGEFARQAGIDADHPVVLVMDGAGWHRSKKVVWPAGIHPVKLPPYSPELQPVETLWPLTNEALANRCFKNLDALKQAQQAHCATLQQNVAQIRSRTLFHWLAEVVHTPIIQ